jgi:hypothetical protein
MAAGPGIVGVARSSEAEPVTRPSHARAAPSASPTPTASPIPTQDPEHPWLGLSVVATTDFGCDRAFGDRPSPDGCLTNVDDWHLTFTGEFEGALILGTDAYAEWGQQAWLLALPGTAPVVGPGGSVQAVLAAGPQRSFRVIGVACVRFDASSGNERKVPVAVDGNSASVTFDVAPNEDGETLDCTFSFDPATLPRLPSSAAKGSAPPTDTQAVAPRSSQGFEFLALLSMIFACAFVNLRPRRRTAR